MSVELKFRRTGSVTIVMLSGSVDEEFLARIADELAAARGEDPFVVDVGEFVLTDVNGVRGFLAHLCDGTAERPLALVCGRLSGRRLLRRRAGSEIPIVATVDDALEFFGAGHRRQVAVPA